MAFLQAGAFPAQSCCPVQQNPKKWIKSVEGPSKFPLGTGLSQEFACCAS